MMIPGLMSDVIGLVLVGFVSCVQYVRHGLNPSV